MSMEIKFADVPKEVWKAMEECNQTKVDCLSIELSEPGRSVLVGRAVDGSGRRFFRFKRPLPTGKTSVLEFSLSSEAVQALIVLLVEHGRKDELAS